jgi:hypothetical protein
MPKDASQKEWLQRSQALWQMLDELADSDPAVCTHYLHFSRLA